MFDNFEKSHSNLPEFVTISMVLLMALYLPVYFPIDANDVSWISTMYVIMQNIKAKHMTWPLVYSNNFSLRHTYLHSSFV